MEEDQSSGSPQCGENLRKPASFSSNLSPLNVECYFRDSPAHNAWCPRDDKIILPNAHSTFATCVGPSSDYLLVTYHASWLAGVLQFERVWTAERSASAVYVVRKARVYPKFPLHFPLAPCSSLLLYEHQQGAASRGVHPRCRMLP